MRREQNIGKNGQKLAASTLSGLGVAMCEKIATPILLIPSRYKGLFKVVFEQPVSGDHRGILQGGRSVLAETKTILDRNVRWSDLREHQPERLTEHCMLGGLSLFVWVHSSGIYVMEWPISDFKPGTSISPDQADRIALRRL